VIRRAGAAEIESAIVEAARAFAETRKLPSWQRAEILARISNGIASRADELARTIALEAGMPV
jgi:acyl-CoA reductase-like NAD-dependent aldehyde dehydrogenase